MKITTVYRQEQFTFDSTGETIEPVCGVWGLGTDLAVFSGYDTEHYVIAPGDRPVVDMLTPAEAVELGEYMAAQWRAFADKHRAATSQTASDCARRVEAARAELDAALSAYQQAIASADNKVGVVPFRQAEREAIEALNNRR